MVQLLEWFMWDAHRNWFHADFDNTPRERVKSEALSARTLAYLYAELAAVFRQARVSGSAQDAPHEVQLVYSPMNGRYCDARSLRLPYLREAMLFVVDVLEARGEFGVLEPLHIVDIEWPKARAFLEWWDRVLESNLRRGIDRDTLVTHELALEVNRLFTGGAAMYDALVVWQSHALEDYRTPPSDNDTANLPYDLPVHNNRALERRWRDGIEQLQRQLGDMIESGAIHLSLTQRTQILQRLNALDRRYDSAYEAKVAVLDFVTSQFRKAVREPTANHLRFVGEAGTGKTSFFHVLAATMVDLNIVQQPSLRTLAQLSRTITSKFGDDERQQIESGGLPPSRNRGGGGGGGASNNDDSDDESSSSSSRAVVPESPLDRLVVHLSPEQRIVIGASRKLRNRGITQATGAAYMLVLPSDLIGSYMGATEWAIATATYRTLGGTLGIDEAYDMMPRDGGGGGGDTYRVALINSLTGYITEYGLAWSTVLLGYTQQIDQLLRTNEGLRSRYSSNAPVAFRPYSTGELTVIVLKTLARNINVMLLPRAEVVRPLAALEKARTVEQQTAALMALDTVRAQLTAAQYTGMFDTLLEAMRERTARPSFAEWRRDKATARRALERNLFRSGNARAANAFVDYVVQEVPAVRKVPTRDGLRIVLTDADIVEHLHSARTPVFGEWPKHVLEWLATQ